MIRKKIFGVSISIYFMISISLSSYSNTEDKRIVLQIGNNQMKNGKSVYNMNTPPMIYKDTTVIPIRAVTEALGGAVTWFPNEKKVCLDFESDVIYLWIDNKKSIVNGEESIVIVPPIIKNGSTLLPVRFISENLGYKVNWESKTRTVTINKSSDNQFIEYKVKKGDTLWDISKLYNVEIKVLKTVNKLDTDRINQGDVVLIPGDIENYYEEDESLGENEYVVKNGDSLWKIALDWNLSIDEIRQMNNLKNDSLHPGQILYLSSKKVLEKTEGLVYYSQGDPRWGDKVFSIIGDKNQTITTSGCGPTAVAMIISSLKEELLPDKACEIAIDKGFRTRNNGTSHGLMEYVAKMYKVEYKYYNNNDKNIVKNKIENEKYLGIVSVGKGHFTKTGHYIVIVGIEKKGNKEYFKIMDPNRRNANYKTIRDGKLIDEIPNDGFILAETEVVYKESQYGYWLFK